MEWTLTDSATYPVTHHIHTTHSALNSKYFCVSRHPAVYKPEQGHNYKYVQSGFLVRCSHMCCCRQSINQPRFSSTHRVVTLYRFTVILVHRSNTNLYFTRSIMTSSYCTLYLLMQKNFCSINLQLQQTTD